MCSNPITQDNMTFACRVCNECIATRRSSWVSRAMMERATSKFALCFTLSYNDDTQENRDAAAFFCYADIRDFLKRLKSRLRRAGQSTDLRFICAGEQGDRYGRCHWHLVIFSEVDLTQVGTYYWRKTLMGADRNKMMTVGKRKVRMDWDIWGKGFVTVQEPKEAGMAYVLSYCLKDQFTVEKSEGTMRHAKAEQFATGLFRMSKYPAIGEVWIMQKITEHEANNTVVPKLQFKVPDCSGYYVPNGPFREKILWALSAANRAIRWRTGADAPQWASLVASLQHDQKALEILNGPQEDQENEVSVETEFELRRKETAERKRQSDFRTSCGSVFPCTRCLDTLKKSELGALRIERVIPEDGEHYYTADGQVISDTLRRQNPLRDINYYCQKATTPLARRTYPASAVGRAGRDNSHQG